MKTFHVSYTFSKDGQTGYGSIEIEAKTKLSSSDLEEVIKQIKDHTDNEEVVVLNIFELRKEEKRG